MSPQVDIHLIVKDGEKYIRSCLEGVKNQTYQNIKFRVFNNASQDRTAAMVKEIMSNAEIIDFPKNYGLGGGFNRSLSWSEAPYVVGLCVDVIMEPDFLECAILTAEAHPGIGVVQGKVLGYDGKIDTAGIAIYRSRRVVNRGHGEEDRGQYDAAEEIFCYEGAVPFFRREALEAVKMKKEPQDMEFPYEYLDEDFFWYADELDLGWRMRLVGWGSWYEPSVRAWHDRQTTKTTSRGWRNFIRQRRTIPSRKRMLDWRNQRLTFIKNDDLINIFRDTPRIFARELPLIAYFALFEQTTLAAFFGAARLFPKMLRKRREIMKKRVVSSEEMRKWFI